MIYLNKRRLNKLKASLLTLMMLCLASAATAQNNVYMHSGTQNVTGTLNFYDSGGPESPNGSYFWERQYNANENSTLTFKDGTNKIQITFRTFQGWSDTGWPDYTLLNLGTDWSARLNDDYLYIYDGESADEENLLVTLTGNIKNTFTITANGPLTVKFVSNARYNGEGWSAEVKSVTSAGINKPIVSKDECGDFVNIYNTAAGSTVYYTTNGNDPDPDDPLMNSTQYTGAFPIDLDDANASVTVKAIAFVSAGNASGVTTLTLTHSDQRPTPGVPTVTISGNTVTMKPATNPGLDETYNVIYTTDGSDPTATNGTIISTPWDPIEWHTPNVTFKVATLAVKANCNSLVSEVVELEFGDVTVPTPEITFDNDGNTTITCSFDQATIYYTTNGSEPNVANVNEQNGPTYIYNTNVEYGTGPFTVTPGTTVKAYANYARDGYIASATASKVYVPEGGSGVYNNTTVLLDDREDHTWSYYSDGDQPIHSLKPADVKITYKGYGENTMTGTSTANMPANADFTEDVESSQVAVNVGEAGNQFIYLKTLENANAAGTGNYPYTMIANPFQVRPVYEESGSGGSQPETYTLYIEYSVRSATMSQPTVTYSYYDGNNTQQTGSFSRGQSGNFTVTAKTGTTITLTANNAGGNNSSYIRARYDNASGSILVEASSSSNSTTTQSATVGASGSSSNNYRGFYAWRVKSMSNDLSIKVGNTTYTSGNITSGIIIYPDQEIEFVTAKQEGNEVEFEALWAQAYVNSSTYATNSGNYQNAYERNFKVGNSITTYNYPVTFSTIYPDGTGTAGSISVGSDYTCSNDVKFENMQFSNTTIRSFTGAGYDIIFGRGITGNQNNVYGRNSDASSALNYTIRVESGNWNNIYFAGSGRTYSSTVSVRGILGSDYDRAKSDDTKLRLYGDNTTNNNGYTNGQMYGGTTLTFSGSANRNNLTFDYTVKSGKFQDNRLGSAKGDEAFYLGSSQAANGNLQYIGKRRLTVEGGELASIAAGMNNSSTSYGVNDGTWAVMIRMKGGTVRGSVYGAAAFAEAVGNRVMIFTGGTINGWVAGGCNGYKTGSGGTLTGDTRLYVGGNTHIEHTTSDPDIATSKGGNVFGAGSGYSAEYAIGEVSNSNVVLADNAVVSRAIYGGGNYGYIATGGVSNVYVLGGTVGDVFGGANQRLGQTVNVFVKGGTVTNNVYGGSNTTGTINGLATINMSGGTVTNVFGGGYGTATNMAAGTKVTVSGGSVQANQDGEGGNVYGGGYAGTVTGNTEVNISGGTMNDVYGAGLGTKYTGTTWPPTAANANISGTTTVNVSGGTMVNVYGGGENGSVAWNSNATSTAGNSTVNISGGEVTGTVYGGGQMGTTQGATTVNVSGGIVRGNVFAGAYGAQQKVYVTGLRTLNITGGHMYSHVYGGSRNANDGNDLSRQNSTFSTYTGTEKICVTNVSGGTIDENVYAAGYFGNCFGSVYAFIGQNAINNAPNNTPTTGITYGVTNLNIGGTIWAGGDWGTFSGEFGENTISGNSNIYVDGTDYETETKQSSNAQYMNIGGSVLGCGTSCYAGKAERTIIIRNYGHANATTAPTEATRSLYSVQFAKILIFDNANINFVGQGRINSLITTEKYSIYEIYNGEKTNANADTDVDGVRVVNGSGLFLNAPATQIANFRSMSCNDVYASTELSAYTVIQPSTLAATPNKVRVNNGTYVEVKYGALYGPLIGYSYMMTSTNDADATCAYARPRWESHAAFSQNSSNDNPNDGGWVSYDNAANTFALDGTNPTTNGVQMPYENHTVAKNAEQYFRIWRAGGEDHYREGVFNAAADGTATFSYTDVVITLPAFRSNTAYYRFETVGDEPNMSTTVDYGPDVLTFNSALVDDGSWISYNETNDIEQASAIESAQNQIIAQPDVNFGLVAINGQGMGLTTKDGSATSGFIICAESDDFLAEMDREEEEDPYEYVNKFPCTNNTLIPQVTFRLTYYNKLSANMTWDPMTIVLVQCDADGNVTDRVTIALAVNTSASIEQEFTTDVYAIMQGKTEHASSYTAKVVLPQFNLCTSGVESNFILNSVQFVSANNGNLVERGSEYNYNDFAIYYGASLNYDNTDGWNGLGTGEHDTYPMTATNPAPTPVLVGKAGGREQFAIDFTLFYDGQQTHVGEEELMGTLTYNITFDNYKDSNGDCHDEQVLTVKVNVWRRGEGTKFYLDGVNGDNSYRKEVLARYPNRAAKSLSTIFNRCGYLAGDEIYVVNKVTADKSLIWNGLTYSNVTLYRYNGGHTLASGDGIVGNPDNDSYKGELLVANSSVSLRGITLDGYYEDPFATNNGKGETPETSVQATAPLITINNGGTVELSYGTVLQNNYNNGNGGAVCVSDGGTLKMNQNAQIKDNVATGNGAGVYMAGTMIVSDNIKIIDNKKDDKQNNVFLTAADKVVTIGTSVTTDEYGPLGEEARIGVTKELTGDIDGYTRVVNVESDVAWLETPYNSTPNAIIYHDGGKYQLVKYNDPTYLYWIGTWVTVQDWNPKYESATAEGYDANDFDPSDINTPEELAWFISHVNGLNGADPHPTAEANVTADIDMNANIWVPIGSLTNAFKGTFEGNGHVIQGMRSPLVQTNMAMFGNTNNATIQNVVAKVEFEANSANMGTLIGSMNGGTLSNVEAAGHLIGGTNTVNMGGLVGNAVSGTIHSAFSVNEMTGATSTVMGGLVGSNGADLYNSYANVTMTGSNNKGGLVGVNNEGCTVENCYVVLGQQEYPAFAYTNNGSINYCYVDKAGTEVGDSESTGTVSKSGTYGAVQSNIKHLDYMYRDNMVTAPEENTYANHENPTYLNNHTVVWNGLLSVLNQWVVAKNAGYTNWFRPITTTINGDLPVLAFPKDNCMATTATDAKFLQYAAYDLTEGESFNNGIDGLLANTNYTNLFLYGNATEVANAPDENVNLFINEDAVLLQKASRAMAEINATVGVTFDNSFKNAQDYWGGDLSYDWHFFSSPLNEAPMGISYSGSNMAYGQPADINGMTGNYMPNGLVGQSDVTWDLYSFYEPQYHWINLKRSSNNHWHYEEPHNQITDYTNETTFVPGKGYMMAISQDSYLNNTGTLNTTDFTVELTAQSQAPNGNTELGYNLLGNPYLGYLDMNKFLSENTNLGSSYWVYLAEQNNYIAGNGAASENGALPSGTLHPHQAFFVHTATDGTAQFNYTMATANPQAYSYYRGNKVNYPLVNLFATNTEGMRDLAVVEFNRPDRGGSEKLYALNNADFNISAAQDGNEYSILFTEEGIDKVPVRFSTSHDGTYDLTWETMHGNFTSLLLVDNKTGVITDMLRNDHYTFEALTSDYASRFYITFSVTGVEENQESNQSFAFFDGSEWVVNGKGQLDVVDVTGRTVYSRRLTNEQNRVSLDGVAKGIYLMRVSDGKSTKVQKVVVR